MTLLRITIFFLALIVSSAAKADESWDGIHITCLPDLDYLNIETMIVPLSRKSQNLVGTSEASDVVANKLKQSNVYTAAFLLKNPYSCVVGKTTVGISIDDYVAPHYPGGECSLLSQFSITIRLNGVEAYKFPAYGINRCTNRERHLVNMNFLHNINDCTISDDRQSSCQNKNLNMVDR